MKSLTKLTLFIAFLMPLSMTAQKKLVAKANGYYKANRYSDAIDLYAKSLEKKRNVSVLSKLAYCYKMNNNMSMAEEIYQEIVHEERVKSKTFFYYAETLMSNEKYDKAHEWFLKYAEANPEDNRASILAQNCKVVQNLRPYFEDVAVKPFEYNSKVDDHAPVYYNNQIVFASDRKSGPNLMKEKSGWTGRDFLKIYSSDIDSMGNMKSPHPFASKLNMLNKNADNPSFTAEGDEVFFTRNCDQSSKTDEFNLQLYSAKTSNGKTWKNVKRLDFCRFELNYMHPAISPDGQTLYFVSDKGRGEGGTDIYVSKRKKDNSWGIPQNVGPLINTPENEGFPFVDNDGNLFFCSKGHVSYGGFDIFMAKLNEDEIFERVINVGKPINSSSDDISISFTKEKNIGFFTSSREGGDDDIYIFQLGDDENESWVTHYFERLDKEEEAQRAVDAETLSIPNPLNITKLKLKEHAKELKVKQEGAATENPDEATPSEDKMTPKGGGAL